MNLLGDEQPAKRGRFFAGVRVHEADSEGGFLRVSCYRHDQTFGEGEAAVMIPGHHVRFSVWIGDSARCAISIPEAEARDLIDFLTVEVAKMGVPQRALPTEPSGG